MRSILIRTLFVSLALSFASGAYPGWDPRKPDPEIGIAAHTEEAHMAINAFLREDPSMKVFLEKAYGFVIFPSIGKGGLGIGGAYGKGEVYEQSEFLGTAKLKQVTIGFQLGGQKYSEIIFFKNKKALDDFVDGNFEFSAQASAVAVTAGASADAAYDNDVAVFTMTLGGLMYEASIGGQKFSFKAK